MSAVSLWAFGAALAALGFGGWFGTGGASPTALIPAAFGAVLLALGALARDPARRNAVAWAALGAGLLGLAGSFPGLLKLPALASGGDVARPVAVAAQSVMAVVCGVLVAVAARAILTARRLRQ